MSYKKGDKVRVYNHTYSGKKIYEGAGTVVCKSGLGFTIRMDDDGMEVYRHLIEPK